MDLQLRGKKAIITGATRGIGRRVAEQLADEGCDVAFCARNEQAVIQTVADLRERGVKAYGRALRVKDGDAYRAWIAEAAGELGGLDLVRLCQDEVIADRRAVEHLHDVAVDVLEPVASVDQDEGAFEHLTPAQIVVDEETPALDHVLGSFGETIAGHVDEANLDRLADVEEVQFLRATRRIRCAGECFSVQERIEERRLADVRAAEKRDLSQALARPMATLECTLNEFRRIYFQSIPTR